MKPLFRPLILASCALLASCGELSVIVPPASTSSSSSSVFQDVVYGEVTRMDLRHVNLSKLVREEEKPTAIVSPSTVTVYSIDTPNDNLYLSLSSYARLLRSALKDGLTLEMEESDASSSLNVYDHGKIVYSLSLHTQSMTSTCYYDGTPLIDHEEEEPDPTLSHQQEELNPAFPQRVRSFDGYGFHFYRADGRNLFPLSLLVEETRAAFHAEFLPTVKSGYLFQYAKAEELEYRLSIQGVETKAIDMVQRDYRATYRLNGKRFLPKLIREEQKAIFAYALANNEGLSAYRGVADMGSYVRSYADYAHFDDDSETVRNEAFARFLYRLNDVHASFTPSAILGEDKIDDASLVITDSLADVRGQWKEKLSTLRQEASVTVGEVRYTESKKTAMVSLDSLDGAYDYLVETLEGVAQNEETTRVVLDLSLCDEGNAVDVAKTLALLSKDNDVQTYDYNDGDHSLYKNSYAIDRNGDEIFDEEDVYGQRFEFLILQSPYTSREGNQFAYYAHVNDVASLYGEAAQGGECDLGGIRMPFGQTLTYSSKRHHVGYDEANDRIVSIEAGEPGLDWDLREVGYDAEVIQAMLDGENEVEPIE